MAKYKLVETKNAKSDSKYCETFDTYEKAYEKMCSLYRYVTIEAHPRDISKAERQTHYAYAELNDGRLIEWDIVIEE